MKTVREKPIIVIRRPKRGHGGHHGGAWKVAFADFMTAMMALFLVLWLVSQSSDVRAAIAGYFQDPMGRAHEFGNSVFKGDGAQAALRRQITQRDLVDARRDRLSQLGEEIERSLPETLGDAGLASHVVVELVDEGLRISLVEDSADVFFASGSARPLPVTERLLAALGKTLATVSYPIAVEGHTDAQPFLSQGGTYTNWELSADRANAARRLLVNGGLPDPRLSGVRGLGDRQPRVADPFAPQNRRVTILLQLPAPPDDSGPLAP
ncbi:MAG: OmpA family protein [Gemmatimonadales bacterium]|nr:OmpA family protein [Gemmatimonadales bacterium]